VAQPASSSSPNATRPAPRGGRLWLFRLIAVLVGMLPFVALEAGLRWLGWFRPPPRSATVARFSAQFPLFERVGEIYRTLPAREPYFNQQQFAVRKPANGFRAFVFGGSTVYGHPYSQETAFAKWLELELAAGNPARAVEVINCGGVSYASYRLAPIVREVLDYQPDLIVLALGHNEFLEDRTYTPQQARSPWRRWLNERAASLHTVTAGRRLLDAWPRRETSKPDPSPGQRPELLASEVSTQLDDARAGYASYHRDPVWHAQVLAQFEDAVRAIIADCQAARVPVLIVTLGSSLRDCPPFKSEHREGLTPEAEIRWQADFDAASALEESDPSGALARYRAAAEVDDQFALLHFRLARLLDRQGDPVTARQHYLRAKDEDICPLRMLEAQYQFWLRLAAETRIPVVNARELIEQLAPDGIPGHDLYLDHVHPTLGGHQRIAAAIATELERSGLFPRSTHWTAEQRRAAYRRHLESLPASYFPNGRRRVEWLDNWARRNRLADEIVPRTGAEFFRQGVRQLDFADDDSAWKFFHDALARDPKTAAQLVAHARELREQGRPAAGQALLTRLAALLNDPQLKTALNAVAAELAQP
jgi:lysophospholipase L1-like esterase